MKKYLIPFFSVIFLIGTDTFLISPLLPTLARLYNINASVSGWLVSSYAISYVLFSLVAGPISDGLDRRKVLLWGFAAFTISTFLCSFATSFVLMLIFRFIAGIASAFAGPQIWASIPVVFPKDKITKMMGIISAALAISQIVGVPIGAFLASISWRTPFYFLGGLSLVLLLVMIKTLPDFSNSNTEQRNLLKTYAGVLHNKLSIRYLLGYFLFQVGNFTMFIFISQWFAHDFNFGETSIGIMMIVLGLGQLFGATFGGRVVQKFGLSKSVLVGLLCLCAFYIVLPLSSFAQLAITLLFLIFMINGTIFPVFMSLLQSTTETARSTMSSFSNAAMYFGETLSGIFGGFLFVHFSHFWGISIFVVICYLFALIVFWKTGLFNNKARQAD